MNRLSLRIDDDMCWGCRTCEVACKQEYNHEVKFLHVTEEGPKMVGDKLDFRFRVNLCRHCDDPPCAEACPEEAISKREDGLILLDEGKCTGCRACIEECPYDAIGFDEEKGKALKCNMCPHRVDNGLIPACADNVCLAHCIYFGDPEEIETAISVKARKRQVT
ncbi:4Fe-4S dicluster domain-containing protein [Thermodesulfobacteriota bacterium]